MNSCNKEDNSCIHKFFFFFWGGGREEGGLNIEILMLITQNHGTQGQLFSTRKIINTGFLKMYIQIRCP